jgi:hypothetical protein
MAHIFNFTGGRNPNEKLCHGFFAAKLSISGHFVNINIFSTFVHEIGPRIALDNLLAHNLFMG